MNKNQRRIIAIGSFLIAAQFFCPWGRDIVNLENGPAMYRIWLPNHAFVVDFGRTACMVGGLLSLTIAGTVLAGTKE